jgi:RNA recognition motif-containing protein
MLAQANRVLSDHGDEHKPATNSGHKMKSQHERGKRLYVKGVPSKIVVDVLRNHFSRWGDVRDVYLPRLHRGERANYCFVTFSSGEAALLSSKESPLCINGKVSYNAL